MSLPASRQANLGVGGAGSGSGGLENGFERPGTERAKLKANGMMGIAEQRQKEQHTERSRMRHSSRSRQNEVST